MARIAVFIAGAQDRDVDLGHEDRVPRFWADDQSGDFIGADITVLEVGVCFGAIHCISWGFSFPTYMELLIWQVLCVAITAVPVYIPLGFLLVTSLKNTEYSKFAALFIYFWAISGGILYILARAVTLILAFTSLRDLPSGAYETVHWTTFIPHV